MKRYKEVKCSERLPEAEDYYKTDKGELYYYFPDENHIGWCAYETRPMSAEYPTIWLEPYELPKEGKIKELIFNAWSDSKGYPNEWQEEAAKAITNLLER